MLSGRFFKLVTGLLAFLALAASSSAAVRGMVIKVQGDQVVVNLGLDKHARPGMPLYVYDASGKPVATVKVVQVDDYSSQVQIVSLEPNSVLSIGESVTDAAYLPTPAGAPAVAPPAPASARRSGPVVDPVKQFEHALQEHTQIYAFRGGKGGTIKVNASDVLNILSGIGFAGRGAATVANPWLISSTAYDAYERYSYTSRVNQRARSTLEVVYWDEPLTNAYADYYIYKETFIDPAKKAEVRQSLLAQKGVQTSAVFQVRIRNKGPGTLQLAPFDWHMYMLDPEGNRVKAERYDEILDKALSPGQEVQGYVYFPRRDPLGRPYVAQPVKVLVEDVFGERTTISWDLRKSE